MYGDMYISLHSAQADLPRLSFERLDLKHEGLARRTNVESAQRESRITILSHHLSPSKSSHVLGIETFSNGLKWRLNRCPFYAMLVTSPTNDTLAGRAMRMT